MFQQRYPGSIGFQALSGWALVLSCLHRGLVACGQECRPPPAPGAGPGSSGTAIVTCVLRRARGVGGPQLEGPLKTAFPTCPLAPAAGGGGAGAMVWGRVGGWIQTLTESDES